MVFKSGYEHLAGHLVHLDKYHPWHRGTNPKWNTFSGQILDLKDATATSRRNSAATHFASRLEKMLKTNIVIAVVPSHDPKKRNPGIRQVARLLAAKGRQDATSCLVRFEKVEKLASGGDRSEKTHLDSIRVDKEHLIREKEVVVLDDVTTSGNSLSACAKLLKRAGAKSVQQIAIGITA